MNRDKYLENIEIKNRRLLLKIYKKHIEKLKIKIFEATEKGNSTVYLENLRLQVEKQIAQFEKDLKQYSASAVKTSYESGAKTAVVGELAKEIAGDYVFGTANNEAMKTLAQTTYEPLSKMAQQIGRATREYMKRENFQDTQTVLKALGKFVDSNYLRKVGIEGVGNVVVGSETWQTAARKIRDKIISEANIKVPYYNKKGDVIRFVHAQDYAKMVSRTTTANVFREGAKDRILDTFGDDGDLVEIIGKSNFPDSPCIPYQGKILSLEGQTKGYTTIKEAKANGLFHPNCIHNFAVTDKVMEIYEYDVGKGKEGAKESFKGQESNNITQQNIEKEAPTISGVKKGKPMTRDEANKGNVNPNYGKDDRYSINCQSCVPTFEARLRGYNVEVLPFQGKTMQNLERNPMLAFINKETQKPPKWIINEDVNTNKKLVKWLNETIQPNERYAFAYFHKQGGHIICLDKTEDGKLRFYDPQVGKITGKEVLKNIMYNKTSSGLKFKVPPRIFRTDNCELDYSILNMITIAKGKI